MVIGYSDGTAYESAAHEAVGQPMEMQTEPKIKLAADYTPLTEEDQKTLLWDTPVLSSKDPALSEGTAKEQWNQVDDYLANTDEDMQRRFEEMQKFFGKGNVIPNNPLPAGRVRAREDLPAIQEYKKNLPDDMLIHNMNDGTVIIRKKPGYTVPTS